MFAAILEAIVAALKALPLFDKWFTKAPIEQEEKDKADVRAEMDKFRETGRPQ